jgi:Fe2+ transport system protein FeoA
MTLNHAPLNTPLKVCSFPVEETRDLNELESRLMHLGFLAGQMIKVTKKAPLFKEPILVEVRGRLIALSSEEAGLIEVEVCS